MRVLERDLNIRGWLRGKAPLEALKKRVQQVCGRQCTPLRLAVVGKNRRGHNCELEVVEHDGIVNYLKSRFTLFDFRRRLAARESEFNAVMLIPTGIDCEIGGHAGDATPAARVLAAQCDNLVLHPNVVNASDINEQSDNCLYVEGSLVCRLMMGTIGLRKVRQNRILLVTEERPDAPNVVDQVINCAEGARATLGIDLTEVLVLQEGIRMETGVSDAGRVTGRLERMTELLDELRDRRDTYDAVALATRITPHIDTVQLHRSYFSEGGPNPWGGVEAVLTHLLSSCLDIPTAHAPTMSSEALRTEPWGVVEPRKAAEAISTTYLFCVLKGLHRAPRVQLHPNGVYDPAVLTAEDISCLVIPDGCVGLPTLAAMEQGITVIAVRNNKNLMRNDLRELPFRPGQLLYAGNYMEAAGIMTAIRSGVAPTSLTRPMSSIRITRQTSVFSPGASNGEANGHVAMAQ